MNVYLEEGVVVNPFCHSLRFSFLSNKLTSPILATNHTEVNSSTNCKPKVQSRHSICQIDVSGVNKIGTINNRRQQAKCSKMNPGRIGLAVTYKAIFFQWRGLRIGGIRKSLYRLSGYTSSSVSRGIVLKYRGLLTVP